ncbi:Uncharacterised protein [Mycobacteroides abscessus subsp. abscessus]|nr:Uncharacterised protein [Mycobacteroides abscessus subsp. abscessus]
MSRAVLGRLKLVSRLLVKSTNSSFDNADGSDTELRALLGSIREVRLTKCSMPLRLVIVAASTAPSQ